MNDGISRDISSISYLSVDKVVETIQSLGQGTTLVKLDLRNTYRIVSVHSQDHHLLAIQWEGKSL